MRSGLTAPELADLELAYAPPYSSAKDPVNMLGYVAENVLSGLVATVQWSEVAELRASGARFVDVRAPEEFTQGCLPGAINIPVDRLRERLGEVGDGDVVVYCQSGQRAHTATLLLCELGFQRETSTGATRRGARRARRRSSSSPRPPRIRSTRERKANSDVPSDNVPEPASKATWRGCGNHIEQALAGVPTGAAVHLS